MHTSDRHGNMVLPMTVTGLRSAVRYVRYVDKPRFALVDVLLAATGKSVSEARDVMLLTTTTKIIEKDNRTHEFMGKEGEETVVVPEDVVVQVLQSISWCTAEFAILNSEMKKIQPLESVDSYGNLYVSLQDVGLYAMVRLLRVNDTVRFSEEDVAMAATGLDADGVKRVISGLAEKTVCEYRRSRLMHKFEGPGQQCTSVITRIGVMKLVEALPGINTSKMMVNFSMTLSGYHDTVELGVVGRETTLPLVMNGYGKERDRHGNLLMTLGNWKVRFVFLNDDIPWYSAVDVVIAVTGITSSKAAQTLRALVEEGFPYTCNFHKFSGRGQKSGRVVMWEAVLYLVQRFGGEDECGFLKKDLDYHCKKPERGLEGLLGAAEKQLRPYSEYMATLAEMQRQTREHELAQRKLDLEHELARKRLDDEHEARMMQLTIRSKELDVLLMQQFSCQG